MKAANYAIGNAVKGNPHILSKVLDECFADKKLLIGLEPTKQRQIKAVKI